MLTRCRFPVVLKIHKYRKKERLMKKPINILPVMLLFISLCNFSQLVYAMGKLVKIEEHKINLSDIKGKHVSGYLSDDLLNSFTRTSVRITSEEDLTNIAGYRGRLQTLLTDAPTAYYKSNRIDYLLAFESQNHGLVTFNFIVYPTALKAVPNVRTSLTEQHAPVLFMSRSIEMFRSAMESYSVEVELDDLSEFVVLCRKKVRFIESCGQNCIIKNYQDGSQEFGEFDQFDQLTVGKRKFVDAFDSVYTQVGKFSAGRLIFGTDKLEVDTENAKSISLIDGETKLIVGENDYTRSYDLHLKGQTVNTLIIENSSQKVIANFHRFYRSGGRSEKIPQTEENIQDFKDLAEDFLDSFSVKSKSLQQQYSIPGFDFSESIPSSLNL